MEFRPISNVFEIKGFYSAIKYNWDEKFIFNGESHGFWEAVFVESGMVEVTEDENVYLLGGGNLILHAPMEFHRIRSAQGTSPKGFIFSFLTLGELPESLRSGVFTLEPSLLKRYCDLCEKIYQFFHFPSSPTQGQEVGALLSAFLIKLGSRSAVSGISMTQSATEYRNIVSYMSQNVHLNLTLSDIARENNVSISYVKLLFSTYAGISPKSYFNQLRLRRASELLDEGRSVTEIATAMNFSSPSYFSAFYKRHTGISPSEQQKDGGTFKF